MPGFAARIVEVFESQSGTLVAKRATSASSLVDACGDLSLGVSVFAVL